MNHAFELKESFEMLDKKEAERIINKYCEQESLLVCKIDFDNETEVKGTFSKSYILEIIEQVKTVIFNSDPVFPHIQLYLFLQNDIKNIIRKGIMYDVLLF